MPDRAIIFIDGNNWFHALEGAGVANAMDLDYAKVSCDLIGPREWVETRYYIGAMKQQWNPKAYADQRRFLNLIQKDDTRISVHLGRIEERPFDNPMAEDVLAYVAANHQEVPQHVRAALNVIAKKHRNVTTLKEKAVDVMLAVDLYRLAIDDAYDAAYLVSADGDFTPAVEMAKSVGKKVYAAAPIGRYSAALAKTADAFITLPKERFKGLYRG